MPPVDDGPDFRKFLFEYDWKGHTWSFMLRARSTEEAKDRFAHLIRAEYSGVIVEKATVPPPTISVPTGLSAQLIAWWKNSRGAKRALSIKKS